MTADSRRVSDENPHKFQESARQAATAGDLIGSGRVEIEDS